MASLVVALNHVSVNLYITFLVIHDKYLTWKWCLYLTFVTREPSMANLKSGQFEMNSSQFNITNVS